MGSPLRQNSWKWKSQKWRGSHGSAQKKGREAEWQWHLDRIRGSGSRGSGSHGNMEVVEVSKSIPINFVEVAEISETKGTYAVPYLAINTARAFKK